MQVRRPFGGRAVLRDVPCSLRPALRGQRLFLADGLAPALAYTHVLDAPLDADLRDGCFRLARSSRLHFAPGDEVRIPSDRPEQRFAVVYVETVRPGSPHAFKRAYLTRHRRLCPDPVRLFDNGSFRTAIGNGFAGADTSTITSPDITFGWNAWHQVRQTLADDFRVPAGQRWTICLVRLFAYQIGSSFPQAPFDEAYLRLWDGPPGAGGNVLVPESSNLLDASTFTNVFRVNAGSPTNTQRPIMQLDLDTTDWLPDPLDAGTYWLEFAVNGRLFASPFVPFVTPATGSPNARRFLTDAWHDLRDNGSGQPKDVPFLLEGCRC
jgi:hypothetical protein